MRDIGVSCAKNSYGRGVGKPMSCQTSQQYDAGLCYQRCRAGYSGVGPVCWGDRPLSHPVNCGAGCATTKGKCTEGITEQIVAPLELIANIAGIVFTGGSANAAKAAAKTAIKKAAKSLLAKLRVRIAKNLRERLTRKLAQRFQEKLVQQALQYCADSMAASSLQQQAPELTEYLYDLDPVGVAQVVRAYNKPVCSEEPFPEVTLIGQ